MFKVYYSLSYRIFYGIYINLFLLIAPFTFIYEGFIGGDRSYEIWEKIILILLSLVFLSLGVFNIKFSYTNFSKKLIITSKEKITYIQRSLEIVFSLEEINSIVYPEKGQRIVVYIDNPNVSKLELEFDMKNIDLFTDLYFEGLEG